MSIILDEAQSYADALECDPCLIVDGGACTLGDTVVEAYRAGRAAPPTEAEIRAAAEELRNDPTVFGSAACFLDPSRFDEVARRVLQTARRAVTE